MNTIIVRPNCGLGYDPSLHGIKGCEPPLWQIIFADYYKATKIIDAELENLSYEETVAETLKYNPDRVVIMGTGNHPSSFIQLRTAVVKLDCMFTGKVKEIVALNKLPTSPTKWKPKWELAPMDKYRCHNWQSYTNDCIRQPYGAIYTSVSCPFKCSYCTVKMWYDQTSYEARLEEDVITDFEYMAKNNIKNIKIMDEIFVLNKNRVMDICDKIAKIGYDFNIWTYARIDIMDDMLLKKMRKAGIRWVAYGVESSEEDIRKTVSKGNFSNQRIEEVIKMTKDNDICVMGNFMFGFWEDNLETMQRTLDFAMKLNCEFVNVYCLTAYPNTPFYNELKAKGVKLPTDWSQYAQMSPGFKSLPTKYLTAKEVLHFRDKAFNTYFTNPKYLNMMQQFFGEKVLNEIKEMTKIKINRKS